MVEHELGICKTQEPLTRAKLKCDWMRQQVVKGPLKINVIMKALRGGLSRLGSDRRQEEVAASIMFRQQTPTFNPTSGEQARSSSCLPSAAITDKVKER